MNALPPIGEGEVKPISDELGSKLGDVPLDTILGKHYINLSRKKSVGQLDEENRIFDLKQ